MTTPLRERRRQLLRNEILQAAGELLNEKGYAAMSMDDLANCAGISKPTLYTHFANKEELILAAVMHWFERVEEAIATDATPRSPLQQLTFILRTVLQLQIDSGALSPRPWSPEILQIIRQNEAVLTRLCQVDNSIGAIVRAALASGEIDPRLDAATVIYSFFAFIHTMHLPLFKLKILDRGTADAPTFNPETAASTLAQVFEQGVRAAPQL